ncbi:Mu transposase C-terminal domain-containing protein [Tissierella sp.]|uniref:Mu transposase C-terminal domain-containing protein n=1 Tax=Tissierella sp. TaxID=41274 RepID=UPI0030710AD9
MEKLIVANSIVRWKKEEKTERLLWIDSLRELTFTIDIYKNQYSPNLRYINDIIDDLNNDVAALFEEDPWVKIIREEDINEKNMERRERGWQIISYIINACGEPNIYDSRIRSKYIKKASERFNISNRSIYEYFKRYWQRGLTKNALLPDYHNCGGRGTERNVGERKRGRPRKSYKGEGINVDEETKRIFRLAVKRFYYTTTENSLTTAYELMRKEYYAEGYKYEDGVKKPILVDSNEVPTFGQFRYWFEKERNLQKEISARTSAKRYHLENRAILGDSTQEALGPGSIYQIDATIADVYLVSRYNKNHIIGRPIVYAVIDVFSRMIVGIYIGLEGPSWIGAMMALINATTNKVKYCEEYKISIVDEEWPIHNLPESIIADRGEFEGNIAESLISGLNIKISNTASYRGDMKAIVERYFRTIHTKIKPFVPGFVGGDFAQRGGKDYRLDAKLDIYQFTRLMIKCVLYHNNHHYLSTYNREEMMIEDDIIPIPINLWNWGIANRAGRLRYVDEEIVKLNLLPQDTATVTSQGIRFKGMLYGSEKALKERWFEKARNRGSWKVDIVYDPRNMDYIYILNDTRSFDKGFLLSHEDRFIGKTLGEIEYLLAYERMKYEGNQDKELQAKIDLISDIEAMVKEAEQRAMEDKERGISNASRLKGIGENRNKEKAMNRKSEYIELDRKEISNGGKVVYINSEEDDFVEDFKLFKQIQKERFDEE